MVKRAMLLSPEIARRPRRWRSRVCQPNLSEKECARVLIREFEPGDIVRLKQLHERQGFGYEFPDLLDPTFISKLIVEDPSGAIAMASLARLTCEMYLLVDQDSGTPRDRYARVIELHRVGEQHLFACGLDDAHAWLPPRIAQRFGKRLESLGWVRDDEWPPYCYRIGSTIRDQPRRKGHIDAGQS